MGLFRRKRINMSGSEDRAERARERTGGNPEVCHALKPWPMVSHTKKSFSIQDGAPSSVQVPYKWIIIACHGLPMVYVNIA